MRKALRVLCTLVARQIMRVVLAVLESEDELRERFQKLSSRPDLAGWLTAQGKEVSIALYSDHLSMFYLEGTEVVLQMEGHHAEQKTVSFDTPEQAESFFLLLKETYGLEPVLYQGDREDRAEKGAVLHLVTEKEEE